MVATVRSILRMTLFVSATLGLYALWFVVNIFVPNRVYWRQVIFGLWTKSFVRIANMRIEAVGRLPKTPFFLVCNHLSYTDIAALRAVVTGIFVAKAEVQTWPVGGRIVRDMGTIFIDRSNRRDIPRAGKEILQRLNAGEGVIVFPEGTSTKGEEVLPFNSSFFEFAVRSEIPVSYASITYQTPDGEMPASRSICWWEDISFFAHMLRQFRLPEYTAVVTYGEESVAGDDRKLLSAELHRRVSDSFIPVI